MSNRKPVVRHFIACERVEKSAAGQYSFINVIHSIRPQPGLPYPRIQPEIHLFAMMTDGTGEHELAIQLVFWDQGQERLLWTPKSGILDFGNNPLHLHGWSYRLQNVFFPEPGQYDFLLLCDGEEIARETIYLRESS